MLPSRAIRSGPMRTAGPYFLWKSEMIWALVPEISLVYVKGKSVMAQSLGPGNARNGWKNIRYATMPTL
jgi:hypothetical protein